MSKNSGKKLIRFTYRLIFGLVLLSLGTPTTNAGQPMTNAGCRYVILQYQVGEDGRGGDEGPQHRVRIPKPFYMGVYEVTQAQYEAVVGANPSSFKGPQNPVESVSWNDAQEFCRKLSAKTGQLVRLPTEAEWEYACRAGTTTPFHFGETISTDQANYNGDSVYASGQKGMNRQKTVPVGSFAPNAWALYDMHGNVGEWCQSLYREYPYRDDDGRENLGGDGPRVVRGGGWYYYPSYCRSAFRGWGNSLPGKRINTVGFRVVVTPEAATARVQPADAEAAEGVQQAGAEALELDCGNGASMKLALIPAGEFVMGSPADGGRSFYNEITIKKSTAGTYFMVCGWDGGYFGLQELDSGKKVVLFSVWDSDNKNDPNAVDEAKRSKLIYKHDRVRAGRFGGEGTGGQGFFDYNWAVGQTYRFLVTGEIKGNRTEYSGHFYVSENRNWKKLVTFSKLRDGKTNLRGYYSFIEDLKRNAISATKPRQACFGNGWVRTVDGQAAAITRAQFTANSTPAVTNIDAGLDGRQFFLATGGQTQNTGKKLEEFIDLPARGNQEPPEGLPGGG